MADSQSHPAPPSAKWNRRTIDQRLADLEAGLEKEKAEVREYCRLNSEWAAWTDRQLNVLRALNVDASAFAFATAEEVRIVSNQLNELSARQLFRERVFSLCILFAVIHLVLIARLLLTQAVQ